MSGRALFWILAVLILAVWALPHAGALPFTRHDGVEIAVSFLPLTHWGFESDDDIQIAAARVLPDGREEKPWDITHRRGFLQIQERRWVPLKAPLPGFPMK